MRAAVRRFRSARSRVPPSNSWAWAKSTTPSRGFIPSALSRACWVWAISCRSSSEPNRRSTRKRPWSWSASSARKSSRSKISVISCGKAERCVGRREEAEASRSHHQFDDQRRTSRPQRDRRPAPQTHRQRQRHDGAGGQSGDQAVPANAADDEAVRRLRGSRQDEGSRQTRRHGLRPGDLLRLRTEQEPGGFFGERLGLEVQAVTEHYGSQAIAGEALNHGAKAAGAAGMVHARMTLPGIEKPTKAVGDRLAGSGVVFAGFFGPVRFRPVRKFHRLERRSHFFFAEQQMILEGVIPPR